MFVEQAQKLLVGILGLALLSVSMFFVFIVVYLVSTEIMPAIEGGTLSVEPNSRVLNIRWEGNEIYVLLSAYLLAAAGFAYGGIRALRKATGK